MDYVIVSGAKRGYEVWRDEERVEDTTERRLDRLEREEEDAAGREMEETTIIHGLESENEGCRCAE